MKKTYIQPLTAVVKIALHEGILMPTSLHDDEDATGAAMTKEDDWDELWEE